MLVRVIEAIPANSHFSNGAGYYLKGLDIDPGTGNISGSVPKVIELSNAFLLAQKTNTINYQANLPQLPKTDSYKPSISNSELMNVVEFAGGKVSISFAVSTQMGTGAGRTSWRAGCSNAPVGPKVVLYRFRRRRCRAPQRYQGSIAICGCEWHCKRVDTQPEWLCCWRVRVGG